MSMTIDINQWLVSTMTDMKTTRAYTMTARAEAAEATRRRIVDAAMSRWPASARFAEITLDVVAERAAVSVKTVLRQFGSRDGLFADAMDAAMVDDRERAPHLARGHRGRACAAWWTTTNAAAGPPC